MTEVSEIEGRTRHDFRILAHALNGACAGVQFCLPTILKGNTMTTKPSLQEDVQQLRRDMTRQRETAHEQRLQAELERLERERENRRGRK